MGEGDTGRTRTTPRRVLVGDAAVALGISEGAVRMRVKRGTLPSTREGGRLYVLLEAEPTADPERTHDRTDELIRTLREQLEAERQAHAEARRIIAGMVERIPAIEAPSEPRGSPETPPDLSPGTTAPPGQETRPWWRRMFGA